MDKKAKAILFQTYWKGGRWADAYSTDPSDFAYAKEKGLMFDPLTISHDDCVARIIDLASVITRDEPARAFLSSLSARRLEWRSGIASWFVAKQIAPHTYTPVVSGQSYNENGTVTHTSYTCGICRDAMYGIIGQEHYTNRDLNILNFERIKWGGVRHGDLAYTLFDLEQFKKESVPEPNGDDRAIFYGILKVIDESAPGDYPGKLRERLSGVSGLKSNTSELSVLIELLACIGVLKPSSSDRAEKGKHDWRYATHWRGEDKYDKAAVQELFGNYIGSESF
jgi:hypothetical protein